MKRTRKVKKSFTKKLIQSIIGSSPLTKKIQFYVFNYLKKEKNIIRCNDGRKEKSFCKINFSNKINPIKKIICL